MRCSTSGKLRLSACCAELLHDARALARHSPDLLNRSLKAPELALQVLEGRLDPIAQPAAALGKEEIAGGGADNRTD
jgi:hypothetical protein